MIRWLALQKFRLDLGGSFFQIFTFTVALIAASDKIATLVHLPAKVIVPIGVPLAILAVWYVGKEAQQRGYQRAYQEILNENNEMLRKALRNPVEQIVEQPSECKAHSGSSDEGTGEQDCRK